MPGYARRVVGQDGRLLLAEWLERSKLGRPEVAVLLGISEVFLGQLLNGLRVPGFDLAFEIEDKTGVPARSWTLSRLSNLKAAGRRERKKS